MKDSKIYASMIVSVLSSSKDKQSALKAVQQNFEFKGTLRLEIEALYEHYKWSDLTLAQEFINLIEQYHQNYYPYLAGISLKPTRGTQSYSS